MIRKTMALVASGATAAAIAAAFVPAWEGYQARPYQDEGGIWTVCVGHTGGVRPGRVYGDPECKAFLETDLKTAFAALDRHQKIDLPEPTRAALASFIFNVGEGSFRRSTLLKKLNAGDVRGACDELPRWVFVAGKPSQGLIRRRQAERDLCLMGVVENG